MRPAISPYRASMYRSMPSSSSSGTISADGSKSYRFDSEIAQRVARLSVRFDDSREDFLADAQLFRVIAHRHPQPQDFRAAFLDDVLRRDDVADRLRHLPAFEVDQKSVGQHLPIGRRSVRPEADEQRALKPPAVLIAAFQVHVRRPRQVRPSGQHGLMARSRIEPHIENVPLALEFSAAARRTGQPLWKELLDRAFVPGVSAIRVEDTRRLLDERRRENRLTALLAVHGGYRNTPGALPRDAPVGAIVHHVVDAVVPPRGSISRWCRSRRAPPSAGSSR